VLQNSTPVVDVAILTPEADDWKQWGLFRIPFYMNPWYHHELWEGFSRVGVMADYINEGVIQRASAEDGEMASESAKYRLVIVSESTSINPETAAAIHDLAAKGVNFLFVDRLPSESPSYYRKEASDAAVKTSMSAAAKLKNVLLWDAPKDAASLTAWAEKVTRQFKLSDRVAISPASEEIYVLKQERDGTEIYFISNQDEQASHEFSLTFAGTGKTAWRWDPETGERSIYPTSDRGKLDIRLEALESILIVLDDHDKGPNTDVTYPADGPGLPIGSSWRLDFEPVSGQPFEVVSNTPFEFGDHDDSRISSFAGTVDYHTTVRLDDTDWAFLDLGPERHVSEIKLNGVDLGVKWWGRHLYRLPEGALRQGENELTISYTTTLANYAKSLTDNPVAERWTRRWVNRDEPEPMGLRDHVRLLKAR